jgi:hypothetical protein
MIYYRGFWHSCSLRYAGMYSDCDGVLVRLDEWPYGYSLHVSIP